MKIENWNLKIDNKGQSLVEILVAIVIVTVVLITLVAAVVMAIRGVRFSKQKIRANFLAQAGLEWVRSKRIELGWDDFADLSSGAGAVYCLKDLNFELIGSCSETQTVQAIFKRELVLTNVGTDGVKVYVRVIWNEGEVEFSTDIETTMRDWEVD